MIDIFVINGTDYSLFVVGGIGALIFFVGQLTLCFKAKKIGVKLIPVYFVCLLVALAIVSVIIGTSPESLMDLSGLIAIVILCVALLFDISIGAAWLIYRIKTKKERKAVLNCTFPYIERGDMY